MDLKSMTLLIKAVDALVRLDEAIKGFTDMGLSENFDELNHIYDVIKRNSIYRECVLTKTTDEMYDFVEDSNIPAEERAKVLLGLSVT